MNIEARIQRYFGELERDEHHRYRSWEHCYRYFQQTRQNGLSSRRDDAALRLGFFLASWGMYRGRSFLLQRAYTAHLPAIDCLADSRWSQLWTGEFGAEDAGERKIDDILELSDSLRATYQPFAPTEILITKIMLGTLACSPACDRYFKSGFVSEGHSFSYFNRRFLTRVFQFTRQNFEAFRRAQVSIRQSVGMHYPLMKLVDMYFFQIGVELEGSSVDAGEG